MHLWKILAKTVAGLQSQIALAIEPLEPRRMLTGTWSTITNQPATGAQMGFVLTNGTIMLHGGAGGTSNAWYDLTPSATGSYTAGTWTTLASPATSRLFTATQVLQSGKVMVLGGEYSSGSSFSNTGDIYDPVSNTWTAMANFPQTQFGDDPSQLLPNGNVLAGYVVGSQTYIYNPTANTWAATGSKLRSDRSDEEGWVVLPDHSILSYDVFSSVSLGVAHSQRYIPSSGTWVDAGNLPAQLSSASVGYEMGPGLLLPDGRVFFAGGTNATAYYTPSTNSWAAGPNMPNGYVMADAPGAVLPDGNVLLAMSPQGGLVSGAYNFPSPTLVYEFNPTTNIYTNVTPSLSGFSMNQNSFTYNFLVLPTGQVAMTNYSKVIAVYTESDSPLAAAVPVVNSITYGGSTGVYTLSGTNLNGINEGAAYGDDNEMSSNYPLVRLTDSTGKVTYATTTNWSLTGVFQGAETVTFTLPAGDTAGAYLVQSVANGVASSTQLAVLVNANTTTAVGVKVNAVASTFVDVVRSNATIVGTFAISAFSSISIVGDNSGDTLSVNLNNSTGGIITTVQAGSSTDTININQTSSTAYAVIAPSAGNDVVNVGTAAAGTALAQFLAAQQIGLLTVGTGGRATVGTGTKILLQTSGVVITGTGVMNLINSDMIVHAGDITALTNEVGSGYNIAAGGNWTGAGIISTAAAANTTHLTTLGVMVNSYGAGAVYGSFDGATAVATDVLIKYTYFGDSNLDGKVDGTDYSRIDNGFFTATTGWTNGDFDYSGAVDGSDYTLIDNAFNTQAGVISAKIGAAPASAAATPGTAPVKTASVVPVYHYLSNENVQDAWLRKNHKATSTILYSA